MNVSSGIQVLAKGGRKVLIKNFPSILTGIGVGGFLTTVGLAITATPKAIRLINDEKAERVDTFLSKRKESTLLNFDEKDAIQRLTKMEIIKIAWKCYIPTAVAGAVSISCFIAANSIHLSRNAALAGLYAIAERGFKEYQDKVVETLGEAKEQKIRDEIAQKHLNENPVDNAQVIVTGSGDSLCYDDFSGRYFKMDVEHLRQLVNEFNHRVIHDGYRPLNEFYDDLKLDPIEVGKNIGWFSDDKLLEFNFSSKLATNNQPCLVIHFRYPPRPL